MNLDYLKTQIAGVMKNYPDLSSYGWRFERKHGEKWNAGDAFEQKRQVMHTDDFARQVFTVLECRKFQHKRGETPPWLKAGSYYLKHSVEAWVRQYGHAGMSSYVSNGAMIVGMLLDGWTIRRGTNGGPNCQFYKPKAVSK